MTNGKLTPPIQTMRYMQSRRMSGRHGMLHHRDTAIDHTITSRATMSSRSNRTNRLLFTVAINNQRPTPTSSPMRRRMPVTWLRRHRVTLHNAARIAIHDASAR